MPGIVLATEAEAAQHALGGDLITLLADKFGLAAFGLIATVVLVWTLMRAWRTVVTPMIQDQKAAAEMNMKASVIIHESVKKLGMTEVQLSKAIEQINDMYRHGERADQSVDRLERVTKRIETFADRLERRPA